MGKFVRNRITVFLVLSFFLFTFSSEGILNMTNEKSADLEVNDNVTIAADITPLEDDTIELGSTGNYLSWVCSAIIPSFYNISRNGTTIDSGAWNGSSLEVNIGGLDLGVHLYTLFVNETSGASMTDEVLIFVTDTTAPEITRMSHISQYTWEVTDFAPSHYIFYQNGIILSSEIWTTSPLIISLDLLYINSLEFGVYNFTNIFYDTSSNYATDTVIVTISNTTTSTTTTTTATSTETTTTSTETTTTSGDGEPPTLLLLMAIGAAGAVVVVVEILLLKKRGPD
ncbi:MAG: hypothetical protein RTV72_02020 [Candidatus Thorarchaeota archaeon]